MADEDLIEDEDLAEVDPDLDAEDLDGDDLEDDVALVDDLDPDADVVPDAELVETGETDEAEPTPTKAKREDDDEEDEEIDPDDVEADLDAILKDRIAAAEEEDDEDEEVVPEPRATAEVAEGVVPRKAHEFMCTGCFLLVNAGQFGPPGQMTCPVGEAVCPALEQLDGQRTR